MNQIESHIIRSWFPVQLHRRWIIFRLHCLLRHLMIRKSDSPFWSHFPLGWIPITLSTRLTGSIHVPLLLYSDTAVKQLQVQSSEWSLRVAKQGHQETRTHSQFPWPVCDVNGHTSFFPFPVRQSSVEKTLAGTTTKQKPKSRKKIFTLQGAIEGNVYLLCHEDAYDTKKHSVYACQISNFMFRLLEWKYPTMTALYCQNPIFLRLRLKFNKWDLGRE